jgi:hypothetical protein
MRDQTMRLIWENARLAGKHLPLGRKRILSYQQVTKVYSG